MEAEGIDESVNKSFSRREPSKTHRPDAGAAAADSHPSAAACFDCSICLDFAADPVVTLCGHLYCWPCIFKWLQAETTSPQQCPVCKSPLSQNSLVPLCGRGSSNPTAKNKGLDIPNRPAVPRSATDEQHLGFNQPVQQHHHHHHRYYLSPWGGGTGVFSSAVGGVLGGLAIAIVPLVSRNNRGGGGETYVSRLSRLTTTGNSTSRRERRVEDSLHQIWAFLLCCAVLCLLFFWLWLQLYLVVIVVSISNIIKYLSILIFLTNIVSDFEISRCCNVCWILMSCGYDIADTH